MCNCILKRSFSLLDNGEKKSETNCNIVDYKAETELKNIFSFFVYILSA